MVMTVERSSPTRIVRASPGQESEPDEWVLRLRSGGDVAEDATRLLHELMVRGARHQVSRMSASHDLGRFRVEEVVQAAADEATMAVLSRLGTFEGRSKFTTWAYKFAILQTAVEVRRASWRHREVEIALVDDRAPDTWSPESVAVAADFSEAVRTALDHALTAHQRRVAVALIVDGIPIDVLAERLGTTRNALYKTLHDARARLRAALTAGGYLGIPESGEVTP